MGYLGTYTEDGVDAKSLEWWEKGKKKVMLFTPFLIIATMPLLLLSRILGASGKKIHIIPISLLIVEFIKV